MFAAHNMLLTQAAATGVTLSDMNSNASATVTIPAHAVGNLILIIASRGGTLTPSIPSSSGTVPTWTNIVGNYSSDGTYGCSLRIAYTVATATNHTSGTWTNSQRTTAMVFSGNKSTTPIGGNAYTENGVPTYLDIPAPAITLTNSTGRSAIIQVWNRFFEYNFSTIAAPSGYTKKLGVSGQFISMKDVTTSDGAVSITTSNGNDTRPFISAQLEILPA